MMVIVNNRSISSAILKLTGVNGVTVSTCGGMAKFITDREIDDLNNGVYVCKLNHLTNSEWTNAFKGILK